jgi:uncharacterized protein YcnI
VQRGIAVVAATVVGLALGAGTALAHVSVDPGTVTAGADAVLTFHVPTESESANTVSVQVDLPVDHPFPEVHPQEVAGWTVKTTSQTLDPPVTEGDLTVTDAVATVTWTAPSGAGIPPEDFAEFAIAVEDVPDVASLTMPVTQTYSDGTVVEWKDLTPPGGQEPDHPAPVVTVLAAGASGTDASAPLTTGVTVTTAEPTASSTDNAARVLGLIGVVMAAAALLVAALGYRRRKATERSGDDG